MEENSHNRDGLGDTGEVATLEGKKDDDFNTSSQEPGIPQIPATSDAMPEPGGNHSNEDVVVGNTVNPMLEVVPTNMAQCETVASPNLLSTTEEKQLENTVSDDNAKSDISSETGGPFDTHKDSTERSDSPGTDTSTVAGIEPTAESLSNISAENTENRRVTEITEVQNESSQKSPEEHSEQCKPDCETQNGSTILLENITKDSTVSPVSEHNERDNDQAVLSDENVNDKLNSDVVAADIEDSNQSKETVGDVKGDNMDAGYSEETNISVPVKESQQLTTEDSELQNLKVESSLSVLCNELVEKSSDDLLDVDTASNDKLPEMPFSAAEVPVHVDEQSQSESAEIVPVIKTDENTEEMEVDPELAAVEAEDASSDVASSGNNRKRHGSGSSVTTFEESDSHGAFPAANLFEYQWPPETGAEWYMLQEQISEFLTIKSFKRKYPDLQRRSVDMNEKVFLQDRGVVSETQCDLGLTALRSEEVLDLMIRDYPMRYREYAAVLHEKERQTISDKHKEYDVPKFEKSKLADYMKKAVKSAAEFNVQFQRERREDRRAYFDLQTMAIHYPQGKHKVAPPESTKVGSYPVALIPGQFQDYYKKYTPSELKYLPVGTALYGPPKKFKDILAKPSTGDTSDDTADESGEEEQGGSDTPSEEGDSSEAESMGVAPLPTPPPVEDVKPATPSETSKTDKQRPKRDKKEEKEIEKMCRICKTGDDKVKGKLEDLVQCSECKTSGHPMCLELTTEMIAVIKTYPWQCMECKTCVECMDPYDEDKMMFCDRCDRGYHTFCVGVKSIPTGRWECPSCKDIPSKPKKSRRQTRQNGVPSPKPAVSN